MTDEEEIELLRLLEADASYQAAQSFGYFVRYMRPEFEIQWFHRRVCDEIQAWADSEKPYVLILQMPPGFGKSEYAKLACAWAHHRDNEDRVIYTSYGQTLATDHCGDIQALQMSDRYRDLCPGVILNDQRVVTDTQGRGARRTQDGHDLVGAGGGLRAVGTGGPITGFRADKIVIDDPLKGSDEAASPTFREKQWHFYNRVLKTRRRPYRPLKFLILLTRWNLDDLAGRIQDREEGWRLVSFEALREDMSDPGDPRAHGESLWDAVVTADELKEISRLDPAGFSALYQQRPSPEGGTILKTAWMQQFYTVLPLSGGGHWYWAMDLKGGSKDPKSSKACVQLWYAPTARKGELYLVDQRLGLWDYPETLAILRQLARISPWNKAATKLVEAKADGKAILATLKSEIAGLIAINPQGSKEVRARAVAPFWAAGNIWLPDPSIAAFDIGEFIQEHTTFPASANDDMIDTSSMLISHVFVRDGLDPLENIKRIIGAA